MPTWLVPTLKWGGIGLAIIAAVADPLRAVHCRRSSAGGRRSVRRGSRGAVLDSLRDRRRGSHRRVCSGGGERGPPERRAAYAGRTSSVHTSRSGSRRSGSPWTTKVSPPTVS